MADIGSGWAALLGAAVGGGASVLVSWLNVWTQNKQAKINRDQHITDRQYAAHVEFTNRVLECGDSIREVWNALDRAYAVEKIAEAQAAHVEAWQQYLGSVGAVRVAGPASLDDSTKKLRVALTEYSNAVDAWFHEGSHPEIRVSKDADCKRQQVKLDKARDAYTKLAQEELSA